MTPAARMVLKANGTRAALDLVAALAQGVKAVSYRPHQNVFECPQLVS